MSQASESVAVPRRELRRERLDILVRNLLSAQVAVLFIGGLFLVYFWDDNTHAQLLGWVSYVLVVAVFRFWLIWQYRKEGVGGLSDDRIRFFWYVNFVGVVLNALGWAAAAILFFHPEHLDHQVLLVCSIAGLTAGAVASLSASRAAVTTFMLLVLTPLSFEYLSAPDAGRGLGVLLLLYLGLMLVLARTVNGYILHNLGLQRQNRHLNEELSDRVNLLDVAQSRIDAESEMALSVFRALMPRQQLGASNILCQVSSRASFAADLLLIETRTDGKQILMLGQFNHRGLAASLGAIPVSDIFTSMSRKGFAVGSIATEINRKLHKQLPSTLQLAACFVEIDPGQCKASFWNGGLDSVYVLNGSDGSIRQRVAAVHQPLGSLTPEQFDAATQIIQVSERDQLFMATDGVTKQRSADGELFGTQRLERILNQTADIESLNSQLLAELETFGGGTDNKDDTTFIALRMERAILPDREPAAKPRAVSQVPNWGLKLSLEAGAMRQINPVPVLNHIIGEFNGSLEGLDSVELTIGELYKNAVDHGVMGLDSAMKASPEGFAAYYEERERRLQALDQGLVEIELHSRATGEGGEITFSITDSGDGFDHQRHEADMGENMLAHGRGIALARSLCEDVSFNEQGNQVQGRYRWQSKREE